MIYRAVVQAILLYGLDTLVLLEPLEKKMDGIHTGFLRQITGKQAQWLGDGMWVTTGADGVQEAVGTQSAMTYIGKLQGTVAQWVELRPIFDV